MSKYLVKRCPHCGYAYQRGGSKRYYGSPLRKCTKCGKEFVDKGGIEIAISGIRDSDISIIDSGIVLAALLGLIFLGSGIYLQDLITTIAGAFFVYSTIYGIYDKITNYTKRLEELEAEKRESFKRLSDYRYALKLKEGGYHVPEKFLMSSNEASEADVSNYYYQPKNNSIEQNSAVNKKPNNIDDATIKHKKIHKTVFGITSTLSIILYLKTINLYSYYEALIEIIIGVIIAVGLYRLYKKSYNKPCRLAHISRTASISVLIILLMYNILYYTKVERVINQIPDDKVINVRVDMDGVIYSESVYGTRLVDYGGRCGMRIDDTYLNDDDVVEITLEQSKIERISCSNYGKGGYNETCIVISTPMLAGNTMREMIKISSDASAEVEYSFERKVSFWEVIFY